MPASPNQRTKLLHLQNILLEKTDEKNPISVPEIIAELKKRGIHAERKAIYTDIEILREYGLDIEIQSGKVPRHFVGHRQFELPELKLLVDAVQSSRFITAKKSEELITKLSSMTSQHQAAELKRQIFVAGRPKSFNEQAFYSVDAIHTAINAEKKITFKYFDYNIEKKRVFRKKGTRYEVTPITLCWDSDKYYLIAYNAEHDELRNYRVDRMDKVIVSEADGNDYDRSTFKASEHIKGMFGMYGGEVVRATLAFDNGFVNIVLDYFGKEIKIEPKDNGTFEIIADITVSPVFFGWMFQFCGKAQILSPSRLVDSMGEMLGENTALYGKLSAAKDT